MIVDNIYRGFDQSAWEDIFSLLKVLLPGLFMAFGGAYYQTRKKKEIALKVGITRLRIAAYEDIAATVSKLAEQVSPTLSDDAKIKEILSFYDYIDLNTDYSSIIGTEKRFDSFYHAICEKVDENDIYLDYKVHRQCAGSIAIFTHMKTILDAYCDTMRVLEEDGKNDRKLQDKIDFAYRLAAVLMKNEINKGFILVEDLIAGQINGVRVNYRKYRIRKIAYKFFEPIMRWADSYMDDETWRGSLSRKILFRVLGDRLSLVSKLAIFVETLAYIHVSDQYSPGAYFTMDEDSRIKVSSDFFSSFYFQLHHNR